jgi:hypothetical protein
MEVPALRMIMRTVRLRRGVRGPRTAARTSVQAHSASRQNALQPACLLEICQVIETSSVATALVPGWRASSGYQRVARLQRKSGRARSRIGADYAFGDVNYPSKSNVLFIYTACLQAPRPWASPLFRPHGVNQRPLGRTGVPAMERGPMAIAIDRHFILCRDHHNHCGYPWHPNASLSDAW